MFMLGTIAVCVRDNRCLCLGTQSVFAFRDAVSVCVRDNRCLC